MRFGVLASVLLHLAIVLAGFLAPSFINLPDVTPEPYIPLDLIREAELDLKTSVPAASPKPVEEQPQPDLPEPEIEETPAPAEEKPAEQVAEPEPEPAPVVEEPEPTPEPVKPEPKPEPPKATPKPPVKKPEPKNDELDLDALSQLIDKEREKEQPRTPSQTPSQTTEEADRARNAVGAGDRLTASIVQKVKAAVKPCWTVTSTLGAPEPEKLVVILQFELNRNGTLVSTPRVENALQINLSGNQFWKVAEREAITAVNKCAPYDFLPVEQYESWKELRLVFNPAEMAGL